MQDEQKQLRQLKADVATAWQAIGIDALLAENEQLDTRMAQPDFWSDSLAAQVVSKRHAALQARTEPWVVLSVSVQDLSELADLNDTSLQVDIQAGLQQALAQFAVLKNELKYSGPYDDHDVILNIYAGAGGTDAQDWAGMLLRMYVRWAEKNNYKVEVIEESAGDEAGLKSVTLEISGKLTYGNLKHEHGVHRLVRLSPFNSDNLRQTSFAKVDVLPKITADEALEVDDKDLRIDVYRAGGHGGQSVNTTDSAVRITHTPTGITVAIQNERSQLQNKELAMTILKSRLVQLQIEQHQEKVSELKGPNQSAEWGNQIRSYVLHPYKQVKDLRSRYETSDVDGVLDGNLNDLLHANLEHFLASER
jgi:peptide chain release factor 2